MRILFPDPFSRDEQKRVKDEESAVRRRIVWALQQRALPIFCHLSFELPASLLPGKGVRFRGRDVPTPDKIVQEWSQGPGAKLALDLDALPAGRSKLQVLVR